MSEIGLAYADDFVLPFKIEGAPLRGRIVRLGPAIDTILTRHNYPGPVSQLLGEAAALTAMLGVALKFKGKLILQAQGDGPVSVLVADYRSNGALRGYAGVDAAGVKEGAGAGALLGEGHLALTIDQGPDMDRYQGVTPLDGESLEAWALAYFEQSEQIPTALKLAVGRTMAPGGAEHWRAGGILIQLMPSDEEDLERGVSAEFEDDEEDAWRRAALLLDTTKPDELLDPTLEASDLLYRLYHEDGVRVFDPSPVRFECGCNRGKVRNILLSYPLEERREMAIDGAIHVTCEFCSETYLFDPSEVDA